MNIVICGAGEVGRHAAEVLAGSGHNLTIIDMAADKLAAVEDLMDVRTLRGNGAQADVLREAGVDHARLFIAATNIDEINLLTASVAKAVGATRCVARVHHSAYFEQRGLDYAAKLSIDHLVCPEYSTAVAIAQTLRNPGAMAIERFARGRIEMQQFQVSDDAKVVGRPLSQVVLPRGARLVSIERKKDAFIPTGDTAVQPGDIVILVGDVENFEQAQKLFVTGTTRRRTVMIMGDTPMGVWLCRTLHARAFSVKMFVSERGRAEELAEKLPWVTILVADSEDPTTFELEQVDQTDVFVALTADDEHNILGAARAKSMGAKSAIAVLQRSTYLHLLEHVGIDRAFSPRATAVSQVRQWLDDSPVRHLASLSAGAADVYEVSVPRESPVADKSLKQVTFPEPIIVAAIERGDNVFVPGADDPIHANDRLVIAGRSGIAKKLRKYFGIK